MRKVLVVEDEASIRELIALNLQMAGWEVLEAENGERGLRRLKEEGPCDAAVLDVMLPGIDGFSLCESIRRDDQNIGIIILSAKGLEEDKIRGLSIGADDYMTKPFNPMELIARVKSQLRRYNNFGGNSEEEGASTVTVNGGLEMDDGAKRVTVDGAEVSLTPVEYKIVKFLMENRGLVFSSAQIYENVWNEPSYGADNIVAVHIRHIREKIEINPKEPRYIKVIWGHGYKMERL